MLECKAVGLLDDRLNADPPHVAQRKHGGTNTTERIGHPAGHDRFLEEPLVLLLLELRGPDAPWSFNLVPCHLPAARHEQVRDPFSLPRRRVATTLGTRAIPLRQRPDL